MLSYKDSVIIGDSPLTIKQLVGVARFGAQVAISEQSKTVIQSMRNHVDAIVEEGRPVYGLTTGVGDLYRVAVAPEAISNIQVNMLMSHACGVGEPYPIEVIRAMMLLIIRSMAYGHSGVTLGLLETMVEMLNRGVTPWSPSKGSVGYLLGPAHIGLVLVGRGQAYYEGELLSGAEAMRRAGIPLLQLGAREGHALMSGTYEITALAGLAVHDTDMLVKTADLAAAMSLEALRGNDRAYDPRLQSLRPHPGQAATAANLLRILDGSEIVASYRHHRLQDALSLRCAPQVHGGVRDALAYVRSVVETEMNALTDNPVFFIEDGEAVAIPGGNGHGAPIAIAMDTLAIAVAQLLNISERRTDRLTNSHVSELPAFLVRENGANSGFMIPQYVTAALAAENRALAVPASVENIPTCAQQEDHVSMGVNAGWQARNAIANAQQGIGIELLTAAQGLEFHRPLQPGRGTAAVYRVIREKIPPLDADRELYLDLAAVMELVSSESIVAAAEEAVGELTV
ncbi:histidine ammonia-lyase [Paenibacillus sp. 7124]|uniref:Histidine ammonia-lyase n=1 Tax=Paenibacillus apii TaxID=1850370 RepID=A0A6M1PQ63_9BACL|nr:histidine ammonia-lyase [Paenibacillus apii]NGM82441.1 histidine ammonia-lyase [Paenibacillus apii]NJJ39578.1 histidine ammonia-lyase [Paenibacillus apii]